MLPWSDDPLFGSFVSWLAGRLSLSDILSIPGPTVAYGPEYIWAPPRCGCHNGWYAFDSSGK